MRYDDVTSRLHRRSARRDNQTLPSDQTDSKHSVSRIRAVILDFGDVISQPPDPAAITAMAALFNLPERQFRHIYSSLRPGYDRGDIDAQEYWTGMARAADIELSSRQVEQLRQTDVAMWSRVNASILRWVDELRLAGLKTAVLSNMHHDMVQKIGNDPTWAEKFNCLTLSSAIRLVKPEAAIFRHCLECLEVAPSEALFVDDREGNVRAAQELGINGIVANSPAELRRQLDAIGFAPLPES
jgi:putative hydrolase of the HAD superfamily